MATSTSLADRGIPVQDTMHRILLKDSTASGLPWLYSCLLDVSITICPGLLFSPKIQLVIFNIGVFFPPSMTGSLLRISTGNILYFL